MCPPAHSQRGEGEADLQFLRLLHRDNPYNPPRRQGVSPLFYSCGVRVLDGQPSKVKFVATD
jgi:hypothetical protein